MVFGVGFLIYVVLTGYAFLRLKGQLDARWQKILFTFFYLLLVFSFPGAETLSHSDSPAWTNPLLFLGYLSLPYLLYFFLLVLLLDILRGMNRILGLVPVERLRSNTVRMSIVALVTIVPAVVVATGTFRNRDLRVNEYRVEIPRRSSPRQELTLAVASDFHLKESTDRDMMGRFADRVNGLNADLLLIPGDVVEGDRQDGRLDDYAREFRRVSTRWGLFGSPGNHESHGGENTRAFFRKSGITVLQDSAVRVEGALWLVGRNDSRSQGRKSANALISTLPDSLPIIVLDHKPTDLENIAAAGADIVVCGHTHHGQLWPLNHITDGIYTVSWGQATIGSTQVFVTSGVQVWGPPVRTAGDSEIMLIHVTLK
jgi:predicted MPP superfamily phosphohydrolase